MMKLESLFSIPATDAEPRIPLRCGSNLWKDDFPLRVMWHDHRRNRKMHSHDFWELVIVVAGSCRHLMPEGEFHLSEGNVFILRPGMSHAYESVSDFALVNLLYGKNLIPELDMEDSPGYRALFHWNDSAGRIRYLKLTRKALEEMKDRIGFLEITLENRLPGYRFYAVAQFMEIIYRLSEYSMTGTGVQRQHDAFQLGSLLDYMQHHCREELRIAKLAEQFFISEVTLYRIFMKEFGEPPVRYLNRLRITQAQLMLLNSRDSISMIARNVGFSDSNYFTKIFRKFTNTSPREYRRNNIRQ